MSRRDELLKQLEGPTPNAAQSGFNAFSEDVGAMVRNAPGVIGDITGPVNPFSENFDPGLVGRLGLETVGTLGASALFPPLGGAIAAGKTLPLAARLIRGTSKGLAAGAGAAGGSLAAETIDPTDDPIKTAATAGIAGAVADPAARLASGAIGKVAAPFRDRLLPGAEMAIQRLEPEGASLSPGIAAEHKLLDLLQNVGEGAAFSTRLGDEKRKAIATAQRLLGGFRDIFGKATKTAGSPSSKEALGKKLQTALTGGIGNFRLQASSKFDQVDQALGSVGLIDSSSIRSTARRILAEEGPLIAKDSQAESFLKRAVDLPERIPFKRAQRERSRLLKVVRSNTGPTPDVAQNVSSKLAGAFDEAFDNFGATLPKNSIALKRFREANQFFKSGDDATGFGMQGVEADRVINQALDGLEPTQIVDQMLSTGTPPETIRRVFAIASQSKNPEVVTELKSEFIGQLLKHFPSKGVRELGPEAGAEIAESQALRKTGLQLFGELDQIGKETTEAFLGKEHAKELRELITTLYLTEGKPRSDQFKIAIQFGQFGAASSLAGGVMGFLGGAAGGAPILGIGTGAGIGLLFGPAMVNRALSNPSIAKLLTVGLKVPPGSKKAAEISTRLMAQLHKEDITPIIVDPANLDSAIDTIRRQGPTMELAPEPAELDAADAKMAEFEQLIRQDSVIAPELERLNAGTLREFSPQAKRRLKILNDRARSEFKKLGGDVPINLIPEVPRRR